MNSQNLSDEAIKVLFCAKFRQFQRKLLRVNIAFRIFDIMNLTHLFLISLNLVSSLTASHLRNPELIAEVLNKKYQSQVESECCNDGVKNNSVHLRVFWFKFAFRVAIPSSV